MGRLLLNDQGQGLLEYALIIALIAIVCVGALRTIQQKTDNSLGNSANNLS